MSWFLDNRHYFWSEVGSQHCFNLYLSNDQCCWPFFHIFMCHFDFFICEMSFDFRWPIFGLGLLSLRSPLVGFCFVLSSLYILDNSPWRNSWQKFSDTGVVSVLCQWLLLLRRNFFKKAGSQLFIFHDTLCNSGCVHS